MEAEETNDMVSDNQGFKGFPTRDQEMTHSNPWQVDSVQEFACLKCPECNFDTKKGDIFKDHAIENHPMSFALFGKSEGDENIILDSPQMDEIKSTKTGIILLIDQVVAVIFVK